MFKFSDVKDGMRRDFNVDIVMSDGKVKGGNIHV